jgi:hypothetical protein
MDTLAIKRDELTTVATVRIGIDTTLIYQLMGEHKVDAQWISASPIPLALGDYIEVGVEKFYLNILPQVVKVNNITYRYQATFESELYKLFNKILISSDGLAEFSYFGTPAEYIQLILDNINSIDPGWTMDVDADLNPISIPFNGESCRQALSRIMEEFGLEFRLVQKEIIVRRDVGFSSLYQFEYGRGKGLYELTRTSVVEKGVITRLYAFGAEKNLAFDYRGGTRRLVFETGTPAKRYLEANVGTYGVKEGTVTFDDIFPQRTGSVTATANKNTVTDASLDFDLNAYLLEGVVAKIVFKTGALAGQEFEMKSYNHATKTIVFLDRVEANDATFPAEPSFIPEIGDEYTLINIKMPESYIEAAEAELLAAATEYLDTVKTPRVTYTLSIDEKFIRSNGVEISCGMKVRVKDTPLGLDDLIRIYSIQYPLVNPSQITAQIADTIPVTTVERIIKDTSKGKKDIINLDRTQAELYRDSVRRFRDFFNTYFDPDGQFDGPIKPGTVTTGAIAVGTRSQNFGLNGVEIEANYEGDPNRLRISGGQLIHFEIEIDGLGFIWAIDPVILNALTPASLYYVYARCNKSALSGTWLVSTERILAEDEPGWYHFWLGMLYPVADGKRYFMFTKGTTFIVGDTITTGRIKDLSGLNFFDLSQGKFSLGDATNGLDWGVTEAGKLTIRGAVIANAIFANDGVIENLRVSSLKTANTGKRLEILADDGGDPATPLHNLKFYDGDGNLALTLDTAVDTGSSSTASAGLKIEKHGSSRKALMTQNGIMSSGSFLTDSDLPTNQHYGSVLGILKEKFFSAFGIRAGVIGMDATSHSTGNPSYGGWFNTLWAGGLNIGVKSITANYTATVDDTLISCYNTSAIAINLPATPRPGKVILVRTNFNHPTQINGNGNTIWVKGGVSSIAVASTPYSRHGRNHLLIWDGTYWLYNALPAVGTD